MGKKCVDILMIFPSGGVLATSNFEYHLGSAYIIAYLRQNSINAEQFISSETFNVKECVKQIASYNPKIVGFTVYNSNYMQCALISKGLKAFNSNIIVIFGGPTPSVQSIEILESNLTVDICVRWEGEETVLELLSELSENNFNLDSANLINITGIAYRKDNQVIINADRNALFSNRFIKNYLDKYPSPYISKVIPISEASSTGIITARGCNQNCVYCNCAVFSKRNIFFHSVKRVIEELTYLNESKIPLERVPIHDDSFTIIPTRIKRICEKIIDNNIQIPLTCVTRCDKVTEDLLDLMKQAGFVSLGFSLESAVPRVLRTIGKVNPPEDLDSGNFEKENEFIERLKNMTSYAKKIGMSPVYVSIMVGLPNESLQDAKRTLSLVRQLDIDFYQHNRFRIYKGTPISKNHQKYGFKIEHIGKKNRVFTQTIHPIDIDKIKMAPKSAMENERKNIDYKNLKILSLYPKRKEFKPYFDNVIIYNDIINISLVKWLQENLTINGTIIHIYSNKDKYVKHHENNTKILYNEFSPTMYYERYYRRNSKSSSILIPGRSLFSGKKMGLPLKITNTNLGFLEYKKGNNNIKNLICIDNTATDTRAIYNLLVDISKSENPYKKLINSKPLPYFQNLCRWTSKKANCQTLDTIIIRRDDSIHICWHSDQIGKVGASFSDIMLNLQRLQKEITERRNCDDCIKNSSCIKCFFPYPLSPEEYCDCTKKHDTNNSAIILNSFNIFKNLLL